MGKEIVIEPFDKKRLNPNSYNLSLHNQLLVYENKLLDMKTLNPVKQLTIPEEGLVLDPGKLYLGRTQSSPKQKALSPCWRNGLPWDGWGCLSTSPPGLGMRDLPATGHWIFCVQPIRIYPGVEICQIYYHDIRGDYDLYQSGKYQNNTGIQPSLLYKDFEGRMNPCIFQKPWKAGRIGAGYTSQSPPLSP